MSNFRLIKIKENNQILEFLTNKEYNSIITLFNENFPGKFDDNFIKTMFDNSDFVYVLKTRSIVGFINGRIIDTKTDILIKTLIEAKRTLIVSDLISTVKGGGTYLIEEVKKTGLDIYLRSIDKPTTKFYNKLGFVIVKIITVTDDIHTHRHISMVNYISKVEELKHKKCRVIFIKDSIDNLSLLSKKYERNYIQSVSTVVEKVLDIKLEVFESGVTYNELCGELSQGDTVIGFGEGGSYASVWKKQCKSTAYFIGLGCQNYYDNDVHISNEYDKLYKDDHSDESIEAHWSFDDNMSYTLEHLLKKEYKFKK